jgi:glycerol-3-phosphate acyltransferase PlsY
LRSLAGYLLGSVPFAVIISRRHGRGHLQAGSGNPGATNVRRVLGKKPGNLCFRARRPEGLSWRRSGRCSYAQGQEHAIAFGVAGLVAAIAGHSFSLFIGFRGGKGVATTIGGLLAVAPWVMLIGVALWLAVFYSSRYVSLASICLGLSLPVSAWLLERPPPWSWC